ncbi:MAG: peptidase MA family metallohydrolase, partial [Chloroflexota bacterium]
LLVVGFVAPASAASPTFEPPTATSTFGKEIVFTQPFVSPFALARVELLLEYPDSLGPYVVQVAGATAAGSHELLHRRSLADDGHIVPNTPITARWRLVPADRTLEPVIGTPVTVTYADTRFVWKTLQGDIVRLHWYQGSEAFGRRALEIGETAVREAAAFLGVTESERIDFFVYAGQGDFYDALGPGTRENVGGEAHSDIRTMFALIGPGDVADPWVGVVIPHELAHLVFDTAVRNPYHFPPRWLNEGVATYLSEGFTPSDRAAVAAAAASARLMPLRALGGQFPTTYERFSLAYAESVSAVDYLVREKGTESLVKLIRSYANGVTDDEAFTAAVGNDLAGFEAAWLADLGAAPPTEHGPLAAPAGPLPPGWEADATPAPPNASPGPGASPGASPDGSPAPGPGGQTDDGGSPLRDGWLLVIVALAGLLVGGTLAYVRRRSRNGAGGGEGQKS